MVMRKERVFVVEDEPDILEVIEYNLKREGFQVSSARDGEEGLRHVRDQKPNLLILDLMLPGLDGIEVCRKLKADREVSRIPIIMVTAKGEESDAVLGLGVGADDYVTKPFSPRELIARVKAVLRRSGSAEPEVKEERLIRSGLVIDSGKHLVQVDGERANFTASEFRLLFFLASNPGRVYTRDQLLNRVVGDETFVVDRNIDVHVRSIRKKLGEHRELIETIRGVGYRFREDT